MNARATLSNGKTVKRWRNGCHSRNAIHIIIVIRCTFQLKCCFIRPNNSAHELRILVYFVLKPLAKIHCLIRIVSIRGIWQPWDVNFPFSAFYNSLYTWSANSRITRTLFCGLLWWSCKQIQHHSRMSGLAHVQSLKCMFVYIMHIYIHVRSYTANSFRHFF
jgi:hypothetical protein